MGSQGTGTMQSQAGQADSPTGGCEDTGPEFQQPK